MQEAKQLFEYYGVNNECVGLFGSWAVNADHDIVNIDEKASRYIITNDNPVLSTREKILEHLGSKNWFDADQRATLFDALDFIHRD